MTVRVLDSGGQPVMGQRVLFHNAAGEVYADSSTGNNGEVTQVVDPGDMVTTAFSYDDGASVTHWISTVTDIAGGDLIVFGPRNAPTWEHRGDVRIMFPSHPGAGGYEGMVGCDQGFAQDATESIAISVFDSGCSGSGNRADVLAVARDLNGEPSAYHIFRDVPLSPGTPATLTVPGWETSWTTQTLVVRNAPAGAMNVDSELEIVADDGAVYGVDSPGGVPIGEGGSTSFNYRLAPVANLYHARVFLFHQSGVLIAERGIAAGGGSHAVDFAQALPPIRNAALAEPRDPRPAMMWEVDGDLSAADVALIQIVWETSIVDRRWEWYLYTRPTATSPVTFPQIPNDLVVNPTTNTPAWPLPPTAQVRTAAIIFGAFSRLEGYQGFKDDVGPSLSEEPFALEAGEFLDATMGGLGAF